MELSILRIFPCQRNRGQVLNLLRSVQGPIQAEPACLASRICEEEGHGKAIVYLECWQSGEHFERHVRSDLYRHILEAIELSRFDPEIEFYRVIQTKGIELIELLRTNAEQTDSSHPYAHWNGSI